MRLFYLLSDELDYKRLISGDAGPKFADDYNIPSGSLRSDAARESDVLVVDNRFAPSELEQLAKILRSSKYIVLLRIVDPYWPRCRNDPWYRFVWEHIDLARVHLLLAYSQAEITSFFASIASRSQLIWAPYVYREEQEIPLDHSQRYNAIALSGANDPAIYPLRERMQWACKLWPGFWSRSPRLTHPGYPDIGEKLIHNILGSDYIQWLSQRKYAFVCSSRCRLEFLKYREIAYAGCVPVGDLPATLLDCPADCLIPYRRNWAAFSDSVFRCKNSEDRALSYRNFIREKRNRSRMISRLKLSIQKLS